MLFRKELLYKPLHVVHVYMLHMLNELLDDSVIARLGGWPRPLRGRGSPAPVLNLDKSALLVRLRSYQPSERRLSIRYFRKAGVVQVGWAVYKPEKRAQVHRKPSEARAAVNKLLSARRAATELKRSLLAICADRMFTLTYVSNMTDRDRAIADLQRFNKEMRRLDSRWESVSVLEWQERGAAHFHVGVGGFYDIWKVRQAWQIACGEASIVNLSFEPRQGPHNRFSKLAGYMGKYLSKDTDSKRQPGQHRYFKTEGTVDGRKEVYYLRDSLPVGIEKRIALDIMKQVLCPDGGFPHNFYLGPEGMCASGYASAEKITWA